MAGTAAASRIRPYKQRAIVDAAAQVFLQHGYEGASVDLIAAEAEVSKQTIYNHFGGKAELFRAICAELTRELMTELQARAGHPSDLRSSLLRLAEAWLELALRPSSLDLHRLIIGVTGRFPELGRAIYEAGPGAAIEELAGFLRARDAAGELCVPDPRIAAEQFLGLLIGHRQMRLLLGVAENAQDASRTFARQSVDAFLRAYAPRTPCRAGEP